MLEKFRLNPFMNSILRELYSQKGNSSPIPPMFILQTLYTNFMYALVKCTVSATFTKASINRLEKNVTISCKIGLSERFDGFPQYCNRMKRSMTQKFSTNFHSEVKTAYVSFINVFFRC